MALTGPDRDAVDTAISENMNKPGALLPILHGIQDRIGYVPEDAIPLIAEGLNLSRAEVHGVVSFYHHFRQSRPGRHILQICQAESCQAMGGEALTDYAKSRLKVDFHGTSADGSVTLEAVYCLGQCACSPSIMLDDEVVGRVTPARLDELLAQCGKGAA